MKRKGKKWIIIPMLFALLCSAQAPVNATKSVDCGVIQTIGDNNEFIVVADGVNIRKSPGLTSIKKGQLYKGDKVVAISTEGIYRDGYYWINIRRISDGLTGWVASLYLA